MAPLPDVDALGALALPLAAAPRPPPEDLELDEPAEPLLRALALAECPTAPAGTLPLGPGTDRTDPGPHPGLDPDATEEAHLGLVDDDDLGVAGTDPELIERLLGRLVDGLACYLYPLHVLACLSGPLRT